ncbi:tauropine dehydrogenase [Cyclospora cayetanensis]|uniref:Tauropine dehydrogenase n=2 Tax=Cyclospora cayetanensis TaxID=88456 RepID=A0A6P5WC50_9EIME|nr:tauropine dehydrogenase [Cyclospora cayetanensis]OEH73971.1 putative opine dehydrogenase [Cyclospora cayetanensis]
MALPSATCSAQEKGSSSPSYCSAGANPSNSNCCSTQGICNKNDTWVSQGVQIPYAMCICIVGGGNIAGAAAAWLARQHKNLCVHVLTRQPGRWTRNVKVRANPLCRWASMEPYEANIKVITDDPAVAVSSASLVMLAAPAHVHLDLLKKVKPYLKPGCILGTLFAQGGFDWAVESALGTTQCQLSAVFGLQHVPWLARWEEYGKSVEIIGPKEFLCMAVSPPCARSMVQMIMQFCFDQPCKLLPNFLSLTLTPSNQIIHPARYYSIFKHWDGVRAYRQDEISWGLYTEFDAEAAKYLALMDEELQSIKRALIQKCPDLDLSTVRPVQERIVEQYGDDVKDRSSLQTVMSSNKGYASCRTPTIAVPGGFHPCVQGRLFQEDVPSGLCVLRCIAEMVDVPTPTIDLMIKWHQKWMNIEFLKDGKLNPETIHLTTTPARYGITTVEQLAATTLRGCSGSAQVSNK